MLSNPYLILAAVALALFALVSLARFAPASRRQTQVLSPPIEIVYTHDAVDALDAAEVDFRVMLQVDAESAAAARHSLQAGPIEVTAEDVRRSLSKARVCYSGEPCEACSRGEACPAPPDWNDPQQLAWLREAVDCGTTGAWVEIGIDDQPFIETSQVSFSITGRTRADVTRLLTALRRGDKHAAARWAIEGEPELARSGRDFQAGDDLP